jgi:hypothetical protein
MKNNLLTCFIIFITYGSPYSQIPDTVWTKTFGGPSADVGNSVKQTNDSGFIIAATTNSFGAGGQDIWLIKTDANGDTMWTKTFGGSGDDAAKNIQLTNDNGYAIFGKTNSFGNGGDDFLFWKTDSLGNTEWFKTYGGSVDERAYEGQQTTDSGYVIVGDSLGSTNSKAWMIKTDKAGIFTWGRTIGIHPANHYFIGRSVQQLNNGQYVMLGTHAYQVYPGSYAVEYSLSRISSTGDSLSYRYYGMYGDAFCPSVRELPDGNLFIGGCYLYGGNNLHPWILKTSYAGNIIWEHSIIGSQMPVELTSMELTFDGGFIMTVGSFGYPALKDFQLLKCTESGVLSWEKIVGGSSDDKAYSVWQTNDGGYVVTGYTKSFGAGDSDIWLLKFRSDSALNFQIDFFPTVDTAWVASNSFGPDIITHNLNSTPFRDSITIEPGPNSAFFYYDSSGNIVPVDKYYFIVTSQSNQKEYELWFHQKSRPPFVPELIPFDSIFQFRESKFEIQLVVKQNGFPIDSLSQIFKTDWSLNVDENEELPYKYGLNQNYPNPFNPITRIKYSIPTPPSSSPLVKGRNEVGFVSLKVYDLLGNEIATLVNEEKQPGTYEVEFNINSHSGESRNLTSGVYFYQLRAGNYVETKKMILLK